MQLKGDKLVVIAAYPPKTDSVNTVDWTIDQGRCGLAVRDKEPVVQDFTDFQGRPYDALLSSIDKLPLWGLTREQWEHTRDLGSIVSIPIFSFGPSPIIVGVLNFDALKAKDQWLECGPDTKEQFLKRVMIVRRVLGLILMVQSHINEL
jgi:hypothetical protein